MEQITGTYYKGKIRLEKTIPTKRPLKVIISFVEDNESEITGLKLSDFSFQKSRQLLKNIKGTLSDTVIEERREAL